MSSDETTEAEQYIKPLNMNGLSGRMVRLPAKKGKRREILVVYGHHSSLERVMGVAEYLTAFGRVTVPDLPGFGGMEPFYKIGQKPTIDNLADYLASFIKLRYKNRRLTVVGVSFGFTVVTRALQKYPELAKKVDLLVSVAGFAHKNDFRWKKRTFYLFKVTSKLFATRPIAAFGKHFILRGPIIRKTYRLGEDKNAKMRDASEQERSQRIEFEVILWQQNDLRTYMFTSVEMLRLDLCKNHVPLSVYHVAVDEDRYFDHLLVEQHMRTIFSDFKLIKPPGKFHGPTVVATTEEVARYIPPELRKLLRQKV